MVAAYNELLEIDINKFQQRIKVKNAKELIQKFTTTTKNKQLIFERAF